MTDIASTLCEVLEQDPLKLAQSSKSSPELLGLLSNHEDSDVRYWVAQNPNTPPENIKILSGDKDYELG
jgi:hypothetical protein